MPYVKEDSETCTAQVLENSEIDPLDLLNKWNAGQVDNATLYVLMQRHLLAAKAGRTRLADPVAFASQRGKMAPQPVFKGTKEQIWLNRFIDKMREKEGKFAVSEKAYSILLSCLVDMTDDGLRLGQWTCQNMLDGDYGNYTGYSGGKEFTEELDRLVAGNRGELG